jgi:hypothetical protein
MKLALLLLLIPATVWAQPAADSDPDTEIARRHFEAGRAKYQESDYLGALGEFEAARKVRQLAAFDYNIARCLDRLERPAEAVVAYERYLAAAPNEPDAADVRARVGVLKQRIGEARPSPHPAVALTVAPPPERRSRRLIAPSVVAGAAVAAAVVGAGLLGSVSADYDSLVAGPSSCRPCSDAQVSPLMARADAGYVFLATAGALAVVDVVLWVRARRR